MSFYNKALTPLKNPIRQKKIYGFDIETYGKKNKFVMGSIVGQGLKKYFWEKEEFVNFFYNNYRKLRDSYIVATNLSFDAMALFDGSSLEGDLYPVIRGSDMIYLKIRMKKYDKRTSDFLKFIDTMSFNKASVEKLGNIIGLPKLDKPSFLGHKPKNREQELYLQKYNIRDSEISQKYMEYEQKNFNNLGANLKITIASTSMDLFKRKYLYRKIQSPERAMINYMKLGYYGGRCEVFRRGLVHNIKYYDVNSLYPSAMLNEYPDPNTLIFSKSISHRTINQYEGVALVRINAPKLHIPYLPYRTKDKLIFPTGTFNGMYTFFELRKALELGYKIEKFYSGILYTKTFKPFEEYVKTLYALRKKYKKAGDTREITVKLFLNSLYGKFAQKIDSKEKIIHDANVTINMINNAEEVQRSGNYFIFREKQKYISSFINPILSIYTTAYARDTLYNYMMRCRQDDIYYTDTDSLMCKKDFEDSLKLGEFKKEFTIKEGILVKPKMYLIDDMVRCKGVRGLNRETFKRLLVTKKAKLMRFSKFKESNRRGLAFNEKMTVIKHLDLEDNKRIWEHNFNPSILQDSQPLYCRI